MIARKIWSLLSLVPHLHVPCHALMLLWQAVLPDLSRCVHPQHPPSSSVLRNVRESGEHRLGGNCPAPEASGGDERPPLSPRGMPARGTQITALRSSTSLAYINTQTAWKTTDILEWTFGAMQTITKMTLFFFLWGGNGCSFMFVLYCFVFVLFHLIKT